MPFQASTIVPPIWPVADPPDPLEPPDDDEELPPQPASTPTSSTRQALAMSPRRRACCIEASQVENRPASDPAPHDDRDWSWRSPGLLPPAPRSVGSATRATDPRTDRWGVVASLRPRADAPDRERPGRAGLRAQRLPGDRDAGGSRRRPPGGSRDAGDRPAGCERGNGARLRLADAQRVA